MFGRFHEWPLRPGILLSMPFSLMLRGARDLLFKEHLPGESFEADIVNKYGRTLYDIFFKPYTRSSCSIRRRSCTATGRAPGVNRAVIDKRAAIRQPVGSAEDHADAEAGRDDVPLSAAWRRPVL